MNPATSRKRRLSKALLRWGIIVLGVYLAFCVFVYYYQPRLLYFPTLDIDDTPDKNGLAFEDLWLTTSDGLRLNAWYVGADNAVGTVLFSHGNGGNISHRIQTLRIFHRLGLSTLIYDYRGYGRSEGSPSEEGTYRDAEAAWKYLVETKGVPPEKIVLFGRSLGGAVASYLAEAKDEKERPAGLILESSFTSVPDMAAGLYPWLPARALCKFQYDTRARLARIGCPVLVVHSPQDDIVPYSHGKALFAAAREPKQFLPILGGHNEGYLQSGEDYVDGLAAFLREHVSR